MAQRGRRRFLEGMAVSAALGGGTASAQAPSREKVGEGDADRRRLSTALQTLNREAGLGVTSEDFDRAEAYVTGALRAAAEKLRPLPLDEAREPSVVFRARRRA